MRPITLLLIVVALIFSGLAAFVAKKVISSKQTVIVDADGGVVKAEPMIKVLIAKKSLPAGYVIKKSDLKWVDWPEKSISSTLIIGGEDFKLDEFVGTAVVQGFLEGEPIASKRVFSQGKTNFMPGYITPGKRAFSLSITKKMGITGHIKPGDRIDVILVADLKKAIASRNSYNQNNMFSFSSEAVLRDIRVLAVGIEVNDVVGKETSSGKSKGKKVEKKKPPKAITLEVTPKQAEKLAIADAIGELKLVLRSLSSGNDEHEMDRESFTGDLEVSGALNEIVKGRGVSDSSSKPSSMFNSSVKRTAPSTSAKIHRGIPLSTGGGGAVAEEGGIK
ncbi:MAG: Flp pilus assembly protein CpaB [Alphaproteobacteria bacterium]|nr:Flp pilus assembly protein CpaB [Alphaproteobacteria bacterium]